MTTTMLRWFLLVLVLTAPAQAAEPVTQTFAAPPDRVWSVTEHVLKQLGWDVEKADRTIGWITTESRWVEGDSEEWGVYAKGLRHRLNISVKALGERRTTVSVERTLFKRERILWMDKDEPLTVSGHAVEQALLAAIERSL
jgi:hypothetical protein